MVVSACTTEQVVLKPHESKLRRLFKKEEKKILGSELGRFVVTIKHAMPLKARLPDKPTSDIFLSLKSFRYCAKYVEVLSILGYEHLKHRSSEKKMMFVKKHKTGEIHYLHLTEDKNVKKNSRKR